MDKFSELLNMADKISNLGELEKLTILTKFRVNKYILGLDLNEIQSMAYGLNDKHQLKADAISFNLLCDMKAIKSTIPDIISTSQLVTFCNILVTHYMYNGVYCKKQYHDLSDPLNRFRVAYSKLLNIKQHEAVLHDMENDDTRTIVFFTEMDADITHHIMAAKLEEEELISVDGVDIDLMGLLACHGKVVNE